MGSNPAPGAAERSDDLRPIEPGVLDPLEEFRRRPGLGRRAPRTARGVGLRIHRTGKRAHVLGDDFITFVTGGGLSETVI